MENDIKEILFTKEQISEKVECLGKQISEKYNGKSPLIVSILKGSFVFMADLVRCIDIPCEVDFMSVSSYGNGVKSSGAVKIIKDLDNTLEGRDIIIVEDILDSGMTLQYILGVFKARGALSVSICTLLNKPSRRIADIKVDFNGFDIPDEFVVGYGLDFAEKYRNLPYVGILKSEIYE